MNAGYLLVPLLPLFGISLLILGSLSLNFFWSQLVNIILGLILFFIVGHYPYEQHRFLVRYYYWLAAGLLILPFIFGTVTRGAVRWIPIGSFSLQPSELIKPLLIIIFSAYLSGRPKLWEYLGLLLLPFGLIFFQPDLGTALVVGVVWLGLAVGSRLKSIRWLVIPVLIMLPFLLSWLKPYQKQRLATFINPYSDPAGSGYQVIQSLIAVGSGGLFGQGLGRGSQSQLEFLPEKQTDFIFASLTEELGVVAGAALILSYWWLLLRLLRAAKICRDEFGRNLITGVAIMIYFQAAVTIAMNLGLMPVTGITLPLVSSGGSSLLSVMAGLGLVKSVWKFSQSGL